MITDKELEQLREEQKKYLPSLGDIYRRRFLGGEEEWGDDPMARDVKCRLTPGFGLWREVADRYQGITAFTLTLPWSTDIRASDKFISGVLTFEVRDVMEPKTYETAVRALLDLVTD